MVLAEFSLLAPEDSVYKLVGPILAKQDLMEAKSNVQKRIEYITKEIARMEQLETDFQSKVEERRKSILRYQDDYRKTLAAA